MSAIRLLPILAALALAPCRADPAEVRPYVHISGPVVRLSDLFTGLDRGQDLALGPSPPAGSQLVVGTAQLAAIAEEFGVDWAPSRGNPTTTLDRSGETLGAGAVLAKLRAELPGFVPAGSIVTLDHFTAPTVDLGSRISIDPPILVDQGRHFEATLRAYAEDQCVLTMPVSGEIVPSMTVITPLRTIPAGQIIAEGDLTRTTIDATRAPQDAILRQSDAVGQIPFRALKPGEPIAQDALRPADLVRKGSPVRLRFDLNGVDIAAEATALDAGALGARIRVLNPVSHAVLVADVTGLGEADVSAVSPVAPARGALH